MTTRRSTGCRQTIVRHADARVAGLYEPTLEWPTPDAHAVYDAMSSVIGTSAQVSCSGRLSNERTFDYPSLVRSGRQLTGGRFGVPMIDILAAIGLERAADVVVFSDDHDQLAVPVRDLVRDAAVVLGTTQGPFAADLGQPFLLDVPGWTDDDVQIVPRSMRAVSFMEFVQCQ